MTRTLIIALALMLTACGGAYRDRGVPMTSMALFDASKYAGLWYEIAHFPVSFQDGCVNTQADYQVTGTDSLSVRNSCFRDGALRVIEGTAKVDGPGRLKVRLGGSPIASDYWVLWVDEDYDTAVVGTPSGGAGWILNRTPDISDDRLAAARAILGFNGYDLSQLEMTVQEGAQ